MHYFSFEVQTLISQKKTPPTVITSHQNRRSTLCSAPERIGGTRQPRRYPLRACEEALFRIEP